MPSRRLDHSRLKNLHESIIKLLHGIAGDKQLDTSYENALFLKRQTFVILYKYAQILSDHFIGIEAAMVDFGCEIKRSGTIVATVIEREKLITLDEPEYHLAVGDELWHQRLGYASHHASIK